MEKQQPEQPEQLELPAEEEWGPEVV